MPQLFQRYISLTIAPDPGADSAAVAKIQARVKGQGFMTESYEAAFKQLKTLGLAPFGYGVWKFAETQWGLIKDTDIKILQGPSSIEGKEFATNNPGANFRISFKVKKTADSKPNKGTIQLFNPSPLSIAAVQSRKVIVRLFAGYQSTGLPWLLFQGNPIKDGVNISREGPDRILTIEALDGGYTLANTRLNLNFTTNTTLKQALSAIAIESNLGVGFVDDIEDFDLPYGIHIEGSPAEALQRLAQISGGDFSVQDGAIQIVKTDNTTNEPAVLFSTKNGNLLKVARKEKGRIDVDAMLEGSIRPGRRFVVESDYVKGIFKAIDVEHSGDNYDNNFATKITARPWTRESDAGETAIVKSIRAKVVKANLMYATQGDAFERVSRLDYSFGNRFVAKFAADEWGIVTKAESVKLSAKGISIFQPGFQGPTQ